MRLTSVQVTSTGIIALSFLAVGLCFTSCVRPQRTQESDGIATEAKALELAKAEFAKTGRKVDDYRVTIKTDSGQGWIVWFDEKGPYSIPGGRHAVRIEQATGKAVFMPGE